MIVYGTGIGYKDVYCKVEGHLAVLAPVTGELHCSVASAAAFSKVEEHRFAPAACLGAQGTHLRKIIITYQMQGCIHLGFILLYTLLSMLDVKADY